MSESTELKELEKKYLSLMHKGICPICNCKIKEHSNIKSQVCQGICRDRLNLRRFAKIDDKVYEIGLRDRKEGE